MISLSIKTAGLQNLARRVTNRVNFLSGAGLRTQVLQPAGDDLVREFQRNIDSFTPGSVPDLATSTKVQKQREVGFVYPILKRTGDLYRSMRASVVGPGYKILISYVGSKPNISNERLAEVHIKGEGQMPKRDFTRIPQRWRNQLFGRLRRALATL